MNKRNTLGMGVAALASILALSTPAYAQLSGDQRTAAPAPSPSPTPSASGDGISGLTESPDDIALVRGDPEAIRTRVMEPLAPRAMVRDDDFTRISRAAWLRRGWSNESFNAMRGQNVGFCKKQAYYAMRFADLADRYAATQPRIAAIAVRYDQMRRSIKRAGAFRTFGNILATGLAFTVSPIYGGIVGASTLGGETTGRASTKSQLLANDAGQLNNELTGMHVEFNLLSLELYQDYLGMTVTYCTSDRTLVSYDTSRPAAPPADAATR